MDWLFYSASFNSIIRDISFYVIGGRVNHGNIHRYPWFVNKNEKQKKRKEPNTKEKEAFRNAWLGLVSEEGFNGRAEQFLYDGFSFCGAEPFYTYLLQTKDPNATLATLFSGKYYGNDSNTTFRLITHLLALMLNDNAPESVLTPIIKRFPRACINKDKKRLGTAEKTIEKYLLAELKPNAVLIPLSSIRTKPILVEDFAILISAVLDSIESNGVTKDFIADNIKEYANGLPIISLLRARTPIKGISNKKHPSTSRR